MSLRVLIVQLDVDESQALPRFFKDRGYQVWSVLNPETAFESLEQLQPDMILLDMHYPGDQWISFLRHVRKQYPDIKVIVTSRYPDLQREMRAREQGVRAFLRSPYKPAWIKKALEIAEMSTVVETDTAARRTRGGPSPVLLPVRWKITLPYLLLALIFAVIIANIASRAVYDSIRVRFLNQLGSTGTQAENWLVRQEQRQLELVRLVSNSQGLPTLIQTRDDQGLRSTVLPLVVNTDAEVIHILARDGGSLLTLQKAPGAAAGEYQASSGSQADKSLAFVQAALQARPSDPGDKFAGMVQEPASPVFYVIGPVYDAQNTVVGAVMVGHSLSELAQTMQVDLLATPTFYGMDGKVLSSAVSDPAGALPLASGLLKPLLNGTEAPAQTRDLNLASQSYSEVVFPWKVRGTIQMGFVGVALPQVFNDTASQTGWLQIFILVAAMVLMISAVGLLLAGLITTPINRLVRASSQMAQGNLDVRLESSGSDEVALLSQTFNQMAAGLQEGFIYRDLLGRSVAPAVREQLRQTFTSGDLRLEGQQASASVIACEICNFEQLTGKISPVQVFEWLNEYYSQITPLIMGHGVIHQMDGPFLLAFIGILPKILTPQESAVAACQTALDIYEAVDKLNRERLIRGDPALQIAIGVHSGSLTAGALITDDRLQYTIMGDPVAAARQGVAHADAGIVIDPETYTILGDKAGKFKMEQVEAALENGKGGTNAAYHLYGLENQ